MRGNMFYDLAKASMTRLAFALAEELRPHGIASIAVSPGWMRTEFVLAGHRADEANWQQSPELARTESPRYLGRAVANLVGALDIHEIVVHGPVADLGEPWIAAVRDEATRRSLPLLSGSIEVRPARIAANEVVLGASALLMTRELGLSLVR